MGDYIEIATPDGTFAAYLARPQADNAPAVVVIQEIFGINADLRATCDELAAQGFIALCPDLFWRQEPGVDLTDQTQDEWAKGFRLYTGFDIPKGVEDIAATMEVARSLPGSTGKVGVMGYCLGGLMTFLTAARTGADAAVAYYGGSTEKYVEEGGKITRPLLMHLAEEDEYINKDAQAAIIDGLKGNALVEIHTYPGCNHAFARHNGGHYDAEAAAKANGRTAEFLKANLA